MTENPYLVGLRLAGKKVVVVGGGTVAQRRLPLLIASGADVHVIAPSVTPAVEAMDQITLSVRDYRDGDLDGAWYAIAATDDARVNVAVVAEAERRRIFCVRADIAVEGTAVTPASFSYAGLSVGVLAGGEHRRSAAIRSAIREALQQGVITAQSSDVLSGGVASTPPIHTRPRRKSTPRPHRPRRPRRLASTPAPDRNTFGLNSLPEVKARNPLPATSLTGRDHIDGLGGRIRIGGGRREGHEHAMDQRGRLTHHSVVLGVRGEPGRRQDRHVIGSRG